MAKELDDQFYAFLGLLGGYLNVMGLIEDSDEPRAKSLNKAYIVAAEKSFALLCEYLVDEGEGEEEEEVKKVADVTTESEYNGINL